MNHGYAIVGLHQPKDAKNVGSVLRAAGCFSASSVIVSGARYRHAVTDTQKAFKHIPLQHVQDLKQAVPYKCTVVAVDLVEGAKNLVNFVHPVAAFYIFGAEDSTLDDSVLKYCNVRVQIPTQYCLNLAAAVNIVLYDRMAKAARA